METVKPSNFSLYDSKKKLLTNAGDMVWQNLWRLLRSEATTMLEFSYSSNCRRDIILQFFIVQGIQEVTDPVNQRACFYEPLYPQGRT